MRLIFVNLLIQMKNAAGMLTIAFNENQLISYYKTIYEIIIKLNKNSLQQTLK